jgi:hypothetical protein
MVAAATKMLARADNPFANFSWIVVPYCTGEA